MAQSEIQDLLNQIIPFRFLPLEEREKLVHAIKTIRKSPGEVLFTAGGTDQEIFLLQEGQVELLYEPWPHVKPANVVHPGHYFGERAALLDQRRTHGARAVTEVTCAVLAADRFMDLIRRYKLFAETFGTILRDKHGIFLPLEHFISEVSRSLVLGSLPMHRLIQLYRELEPALHRLSSDPLALDWAALAYAIRRLPANVTSTYAWFLTDDIPATYHNPGKLFPAILSPARRREIWEMGQGKNMVLLRNGITDILDLISNLCLYAVEARKIRLRLHAPEVLAALHDQVHSPTKAALSVPRFLETLPFNRQERENLYKIWGESVTSRLYELAIHHEDFVVAVERQLNNYNHRRSEKWISQVAQAIGRLVGTEVENFPPDWEIHIISSNTHTVTNLLSPHWPQERDRVLDWARSIGHPFLNDPWDHEEDLVYGLLVDFVKANPSSVPSSDLDSSEGILNLKDTSSTGIQVQLIDTRKLRGKRLDPWIPPIPKDRTVLIVNIDYAFGEQAGEILRNLITLFQHRIRSINILGKAGGLIGQRGDILVPTAFIRQSDDDFSTVPPTQEAEMDRLTRRIGNKRIHLGPLLTVPGTLLQNEGLLRFYQNIWKCVGLEMEGDYFSRRINQAVKQGHLDDTIVQRYFYYVSDLPLQSEENLSQPLSPAEGIPPLYAITREILISLLGTELVFQQKLD